MATIRPRSNAKIQQLLCRLVRQGRRPGRTPEDGLGPLSSYRSAGPARAISNPMMITRAGHRVPDSEQDLASPARAGPAGRQESTPCFGAAPARGTGQTPAPGSGRRFRPGGSGRRPGRLRFRPGPFGACGCGPGSVRSWLSGRTGPLCAGTAGRGVGGLRSCNGLQVHARDCNRLQMGCRNAGFEIAPRVKAPRVKATRCANRPQPPPRGPKGLSRGAGRVAGSCGQSTFPGGARRVGV